MTPRPRTFRNVTKVDEHGQPSEVVMFDPGQDTSDPSPAAADKPRDPWFTADSAPTKALPKGW